MEDLPGNGLNSGSPYIHTPSPDIGSPESNTIESQTV